MSAESSVASGEAVDGSTVQSLGYPEEEDADDVGCPGGQLKTQRLFDGWEVLSPPHQAFLVDVTQKGGVIRGDADVVEYSVTCEDMGLWEQGSYWK